jgi:hypothetical protein
MFFMKKLCMLAGVLAAVFLSATGQAIRVPFDLGKWDTIGTALNKETYKGKESVLLKSGAIYTKGLDFRDGVIEVDMSFPQQRGFPGIGFRMQDISNFENFYVRPHQSGNPDASQYTPVFNGLAGWQLYHGDGYTKAFTFKFNEWHHVKIDVHGLQAEIYIDDMETPFIKVTELKREWKGGNIALISGGATIYFANLQYTLRESTAPVRMPVPVNGTGGMITQWHLSNVINRNFVDKNYQLTPEMIKKLTWTTQQSEPSGTINLAKYTRSTDTARTMVVKVIIESGSEQVKTLSFGFSDYVTVFLNHKAVYGGSDNFLSRDYRFLGTMGFFDRLFLPLKKGANELWFVVSEDFGGWGLKAKLDDMTGISLK